MNNQDRFSFSDKIWFFNIFLFIIGCFFSPSIIILAILLNIVLIFKKKKKPKITQEKDFSSSYEIFLKFKEDGEN